MTILLSFITLFFLFSTILTRTPNPNPKGGTSIPSTTNWCANGCDGYYDGCNSCSCILNDDGTYTSICTLRACSPNELQDPYCIINEPCWDGCATMNQGCFDCTCEDGYQKCTEISTNNCNPISEPKCTSCLNNLELDTNQCCKNTCEEPDLIYRCDCRVGQYCKCPNDYPIYDYYTKTCITEEDCDNINTQCPHGCNTFSYDGCNLCDCSNPDLPNCELKLCDQTYDRICVDIYESPCPDHCKVYTPGCSICYCDNETGQMYCNNQIQCFWEGIPACIECEEDYKWDDIFQQCIPIDGTEDINCENCDRYFDGCNWCYCNPDSTLAACTRIWCEEPRSDPICYNENNNQCPDNCRLWYDGCNECECEGDIMACTERFCIQHEEPYCMDCFGGFIPNGNECVVEQNIGECLGDAITKDCHKQYCMCEDNNVACYRCTEEQICGCENGKILDIATNTCIKRNQCRNRRGGTNGS